MLFSALPLEVWTLCLDLTLLYLISCFFTSCSHFFFTSVCCFKRVTIRSLHNLSCAFQICDTLSLHPLCSVLCCSQLLLHNILHMHFSITCFILPILSWMPMLLQNDCQHGSRESFHDPVFAKCFVTIPSATPIVRAYNSVSAELKLTVYCVLDHSVSVALPHCTTPPLVFLHVVACPAQSLSVCTFTNFESVMISIRLFALGAP